MSTGETKRSDEVALRSSPPGSAPNGDPKETRRWRPWLIGVGSCVLFLVVGVAAVATRGAWLPLDREAGGGNEQPHGPADSAHDHAHDDAHRQTSDTSHGHVHGASCDHTHDEAPIGGHRPTGQTPAVHAGHDEATALSLSAQARKNIGLKMVTVEKQDFERTISVPAALTDRPGRSRLAVSAPMTGIVERVVAIRGEAVSPGAPLFEMRLTHEDLVAKQGELLRAVEELDVIRREVARLDRVTSSGAVAGKALLERQYEQQKTEALIRAERQALLLHGLSEEQVDAIVEDRLLLNSFIVRAPSYQDCHAEADHVEYLQVAELVVQQGEHVTAGTRLCTLTDHCELYVEGRAFEHDAVALHRATKDQAHLTALVVSDTSDPVEISDLQILFVENEVEVESRALKFYVRLPNELVHDALDSEGRRFIGWRYKPGQRVELLVPVERWKQQIVLPVDAIAQDGIETYVYQYNQDHFDRRTVHVQYRDQRFAVIEADGTVKPGDRVAGKGAYQIHLALKNKSSGVVDAHAGHGH